jgi:hypothetical protein
VLLAVFIFNDAVDSNAESAVSEVNAAPAFNKVALLALPLKLPLKIGAFNVPVDV